MTIISLNKFHIWRDNSWGHWTSENRYKTCQLKSVQITYSKQLIMLLTYVTNFICIWIGNSVVATVSTTQIFTWLFDETVKNAWLLRKKYGGNMTRLKCKEQTSNNHSILLHKREYPQQIQGTLSSEDWHTKCVSEDIHYDGVKLQNYQEKCTKMCKGGCKRA